jgi:hypothetical protein
MVCDSSGKEIFDLLLNVLKDNKSVHLNIIWSTMGFQIAALGWLLTSTDARAYLEKHRKLVLLFLFVIVTLWVAHIGMIYGTFKESEIVVAEIKRNAFFLGCLEKTEQVFNLYRLNITDVLARLFFTSILFIALLFLVSSVKNIQIKSVNSDEIGNGK